MKTYGLKENIHQINLYLQQLLNDNLVGIYYHGSVAMNSFRPDKSDLDFIVIIYNSLPINQKISIINFFLENEHLAPRKGFETSFVLLQYCQNFIYPTPYELHYSNVWKLMYLENKEIIYSLDSQTDFDLAAHFTIIQNTNPIVYGKPVNQVFKEIDRAFYIDSIVKDIINAKNDIIYNTSYITLNLCRVLAYLKENTFFSKEEAGNWGLVNLNSKYYQLIQQSLDCYLNLNPIVVDKMLMDNFATEILNEILNLKSYL